MAETITFRSAKMETGQFIIDIPTDQRGAVIGWLKSKKDKPYDLTIKEHREKRSLDANAYAWVLIHKLAQAMRIKPVEVYRQAIRDIGGNFTPMCVREKDVNRFIKSWESNGLGWPVDDLGGLTSPRMPQSCRLSWLQHLRYRPDVHPDRQPCSGLQGFRNRNSDRREAISLKGGMALRKDTKARDFDKKAKLAIMRRDCFDGWPCCVNCGAPAPSNVSPVWSNAHFIGRAQGGLGVEENGLTLCPECHRKYDQTTERPQLREYFREYLMDHYPGWDEEKLYYRKGTV